MKARLVFGLVASLLALSSAADAGPKKRGIKHAPRPTATAAHEATTAKKTVPASVVETRTARAVETPGARAVETRTTRAVETPAASAPASATSTKGHGADKGSRFLAAGVPLAEVREGRLRSAGGAKLPCGTKARWAKVKSRWQALDAFGRVTGTLTIGGSDRDLGTGCHQVWFAEGTGQDTRGVFVAEGSGYSAGPSAEWKADGAQKKRFESLYSAQENAWVEGKTPRTEGSLRALYFKLPTQEVAADAKPTSLRPERWAVAGGRVLVVAYVGATGAWKVAHVSPPNGKNQAYEPLAVLDMNGDGLPEIVVHEEAGGVFTDRVLSFDPASMRWETAVNGPGGASR